MVSWIRSRVVDQLGRRRRLWVLRLLRLVWDLSLGTKDLASPVEKDIVDLDRSRHVASAFVVLRNAPSMVVTTLGILDMAGRCIPAMIVLATVEKDILPISRNGSRRRLRIGLSLSPALAPYVRNNSSASTEADEEEDSRIDMHGDLLIDRM